MKSRSNPFSGASVLLSSLVSFSMAHADDSWWNTTSGSWGSGANWSDAASGGSTGVVPNALDSATFNQTAVNGITAVTLDGNQSILGLTFGNTGTTTLTAGSSASTLTLGRGGITLASGAGAVTLGDGSAANDVLLILNADQQAWTNNSASDFTLNNTVASITRSTGASLVFSTPSTGRFKMSTTVLPNTNGIIGPWALYSSPGTAANQTAAGYNYAFNNAGTIAAFTGAMVSAWDAASGSLPNNAAVNYDITGGTSNARGYNITANTLRITSASASSIGFITTYILQTNGILNAGAGTVTFNPNASNNAIRVGANLELVLAAMGGDISVTGRIINNGAATNTSTPTGTASNMTIMGGEGRTITFSGGSSTFITGMTTVNSGKLVMNRSSGANSVHTGGLTINPGGTVEYGASAGTNQIADSASVTINGGNLDLTTKSDTISSLTIKSGSITGTSGVLSTTGGINAESGEISGILGGAGGLTKTTGGTLTLSNANTYNGATLVSAGTLALNGSGSFANSALIDVQSSGTLSIAGVTTSTTIGGATAQTLKGTGKIDLGAKTMTVGVIGVLSPGASAGTLEFIASAGGKLDFAAGSEIQFELGSSSDLLTFSSAGDWLSGAGNATLALTLLGGFDYTNTYTIFQNVTTTGFGFFDITGYDDVNYTANFVQIGNDYNLSFTPVPEPGAALLGGLGLLALLRRRRA